MVRRLVSGRRHLLYANLQNHRQCPAGGFYFVRFFGPCFDGSRCRIGLDGGRARGRSPVNTSHRRQGLDDLAQRSCTARCFSGRVSVDFAGCLATFSCRHRFVHLSFRNKGAFAKTKLWASSAAFAFGGRTVEFVLQTSGTACGFCLPGLRTPFRTRPGRAVCMSDVWAPWTGR